MTKLEDIICPVCGYYCLGKGGMGCIDKPFYLSSEKLEDIRFEKPKKPAKLFPIQFRRKKEKAIIQAQNNMEG